MAHGQRASDNTGMSERQLSSVMRRAAAILTWVVVTVLALYIMWISGDRLRANGILAVAMASINLLAMLMVTNDSPHVSPGRRRIAHAVQLASALVFGLVLSAAALNHGMRHVLSATGDPQNVILLGAGSEESVERSEVPVNAVAAGEAPEQAPRPPGPPSHVG